LSCVVSPFTLICAGPKQRKKKVKTREAIRFIIDLNRIENLLQILI